MAEFLYLKLGEECAEVTQRVSKLIQFGPDEVEPGQKLTNAQRLRIEINDVLAVVDLLEKSGFPLNVGNEMEEHADTKRMKIAKFLSYSRRLGCVD